MRVFRSDLVQLRQRLQCAARGADAIQASLIARSQHNHTIVVPCRAKRTVRDRCDGLSLTASNGNSSQRVSRAKGNILTVGRPERKRRALRSAQLPQLPAIEWLDPQSRHSEPSAVAAPDTKLPSIG